MICVCARVYVCSAYFCICRSVRARTSGGHHLYLDSIRIRWLQQQSWSWRDFEIISNLDWSRWFLLSLQHNANRSNGWFSAEEHLFKSERKETKILIQLSRFGMFAVNTVFFAQKRTFLRRYFSNGSEFMVKSYETYKPMIAF